MSKQLLNSELVLNLAKRELFEGIEIECYEDQYGDFRITRKQISDALQYSDTTSFNKIIQRNKNVIGDAVQVKLSSTDNKKYLTETYTFEQLFQILRFSKQPLANALMNWAALTLKQLVMNKADLKFHRNEDAFNYKAELNKIKEELISEFRSEMNGIRDENKELKDSLNEMKNTLIFKQYENPKHKFETAITKFAIHNNFNGSQRYYHLYRNLENWLGFKLPSNKGYTTKEYIIANIGVEVVESFVDGIISGRIVKSKEGNWVDRNGVFCNPIEWDKTKREFNNSCAYCGDTDVILIEEHIIPQSKPNTTDQIKNIVPACQSCNESKGTHTVKEWYYKQDFFSQDRLENIKSHWKSYEL